MRRSLRTVAFAPSARLFNNGYIMSALRPNFGSKDPMLIAEEYDFKV